MRRVILHKELTEKVIGCFYTVYDELGGGFLESVYEKALIIEFSKLGIEAEAQKAINVYYKKQLVGEFRADIIVENSVLVEIKAVSNLQPAHEAQLLNYLRATGIRVGLLVNFGDRISFRRKVF